MNVMHRNLKSTVSATVGGKVEVRTQASDGSTWIDSFAPDDAEAFANALAKAAKMARAVAAPTTPPGPEERP